MKKMLMAMTLTATCGAAMAKMDLVTVPSRDTVQLTIYNSADMTLVREQRDLTLKKGINKLQFSWANTLIDPTSLEMMPKKNGDKIDIQDLVFPPRVTNLGLWNVDSRVTGKSPVEISYLTSGLSWRAFYMGTLTPDEKKLRLQGYVRVTNNSGEDYENAETRLIVGKVHMLDQISTLAKRAQPYGSPVRIEKKRMTAFGNARSAKMKKIAKPMTASYAMLADNFAEAREIKKEGLSEYFLYTIEGTETIANGWSKRLPSFDTTEIPVVNLYKYEEQRFGLSVRRYLSFKNDEQHELGDTPIPGGGMKVYRSTGEDEHLSYQGQSSFKYIPVNEKVELDLGSVQNVTVDVNRMKEATANYRFHNKGQITGWDEIKDYKIEVRNTRSVPVKIEIKRNFKTSSWTLAKAGEYGTYVKDDKDTVKFTIELPPESSKEFTYQLTTYHGVNQEGK